MTDMINEPVYTTGATALWMEASLKQDAVTSAELMQEHAQEIGRALLADPAMWRKWKDVAKRALVPTAVPTANLFDVVELLMEVQRQLLVFGNADATVMALEERVYELLQTAELVLVDCYVETNRRADFLGPDIAQAVVPGLELQPQLLA